MFPKQSGKGKQWDQTRGRKDVRKSMDKSLYRCKRNLGLAGLDPIKQLAQRLPGEIPAKGQGRAGQGRSMAQLNKRAYEQQGLRGG